MYVIFLTINVLNIFLFLLSLMFNLIYIVINILLQEFTERGDENSLIIERILILIRNILYIPADPMEKRPDNDASVHDQV